MKKYRIILNEFIKKMDEYAKEQNLLCYKWIGPVRLSNNILKLYKSSGEIVCLLYIKVSTKKSPYLWGLTANRLDELQGTNKKWLVVLLFDTSETGYVMTSKEVMSNRREWSISHDAISKFWKNIYTENFVRSTNL